MIRLSETAWLTAENLSCTAFENVSAAVSIFEIDIASLASCSTAPYQFSPPFGCKDLPLGSWHICLLWVRELSLHYGIDLMKGRLSNSVIDVQFLAFVTLSQIGHPQIRCNKKGIGKIATWSTLIITDCNVLCPNIQDAGGCTHLHEKIQGSESLFIYRCLEVKRVTWPRLSS